MGVDWIQTDRGEEIVAAQIMRMLPSPRPVMIVAHRGVSQLAPENTLPAFRKAIALGLDYMEADVWMSKDNRMVVIHDFRVDGKTNGTGIVRNRTFAELRALDAGSKFGKPYAGEKIPTLEEVLELARGKIKLYLDAKYIDPARLVDALRTHRMENDTVVYGGPSVLKELTARAPELKVMPRLEKPDYLDKLAAEVHPYAFDVRWDILSPELIDRCHSLGIKVFSDAIGNHESVSEYRKAVSWGIDAIQTDHPLRLLNAVTRTQQPEMRVERRLTELLRRAGAIASGVRCFATLSMTGARFLDSAGAGTL
jgi:glycerophosphoryl diester phosphodiesterase